MASITRLINGLTRLVEWLGGPAGAPGPPWEGGWVGWGGMSEVLSKACFQKVCHGSEMEQHVLKEKRPRAK